MSRKKYIKTKTKYEGKKALIIIPENEWFRGNSEQKKRASGA